MPRCLHGHRSIFRVTKQIITHFHVITSNQKQKVDVSICPVFKGVFVTCIPCTWHLCFSKWESCSVCVAKISAKVAGWCKVFECEEMKIDGRGRCQQFYSVCCSLSIANMASIVASGFLNMQAELLNTDNQSEYVNITFLNNLQHCEEMNLHRLLIP